MFGIFGNLFDFNHDGKLDGFEQAAEFATFMSMLDEEEKRRKKELYDDEEYGMAFEDDDEMDFF